MEEVKAKYGQDVSKNQRSMARLMKEAQRVKEILSANQESSVGVFILITFLYSLSAS